jgi:hypothetical protein
VAFAVTDLEVEFMVTSARDTAKTPALFGRGTEDVISILQTVGAGGDGSFWGNKFSLIFFKTSLWFN